MTRPPLGLRRSGKMLGVGVFVWRRGSETGLADNPSIRLRSLRHGKSCTRGEQVSADQSFIEELSLLRRRTGIRITPAASRTQVPGSGTTVTVNGAEANRSADSE